MKNKTYLFVLLMLITLFSCSRGPRQVKRTFFRMDTISDITLVVERDKDTQKIWKSIDSLLEDWEERFSVTHSRSEVRALNERRTSTVPVKAQLREMLETALSYGDSLDGDFDITVLPLKEIWGFGEESSVDSAYVPDPEQIDRALESVDYKKVRIVGDSVLFLSPDTKIDVGGVAKGFVLREIGALLDRNNLGSYLVAAGGDIVARGHRADGKPWIIGIQHPRERGGIIASLQLEGGSIVTSGDYERFRIVNGTRYHHIFDPSTGYSCNKNQSVTILSSDPVRADILSTGLFCRGADEIMEYVNARPGIQSHVVDSSGEVHTSKGWSGGREKGR